MPRHFYTRDLEIYVSELKTYVFKLIIFESFKFPHEVKITFN